MCPLLLELARDLPALGGASEAKPVKDGGVPDAQGATKHVTKSKRFDEMYTEEHIYFAKIDIQGAEAHTMGPGKPMEKYEMALCY
jgi:hypothetical protein